jgi:putative membrane protein
MADQLVHLNAFLNTTCAVLLIYGFSAIKKGLIVRHRRTMKAAFCISVLFLISYLCRFYLTGVHRYPGDGFDRTLYLGILFTHTVLAATVPFLAIRTIVLAMQDKIEKHRKWARITFPIWLYVSVTGVIVYWMLYWYAV